MKKIFLTLSGLFALSMIGAAQATVLTFDDLDPACSGLCDDIESYGGLTWGEGFGYLHSPTYGDPSVDNGYDHGTVSGEFVAYNAFEQTVSVSDGLFDFNGAYLTGAWNHNLNVEVTGLRDGVEVYQETVLASHFEATWFQFDFLDIDELVFDSSGGTAVGGLGGSGTHFAMDNFTFNESVPEPASLMLFGLALAGLGLRRFTGASA